MSGAWPEAILPTLVAAAVFILPGLTFRLAGWSPRSLAMYFFCPALSVAIIATASNLAHFAGIRWSILPVLVVTVVAACLAYLVRRWVCVDDETRPQRWSVIAAVVGLTVAAAIISGQLVTAFVGPENISQTFDNLVHLNSIRFALDAGDSSAIQIGATSDVGFYPNAWHSMVTLTAEITGANVALAVNTVNIVIGAVVWPASCLALSAVLFRERAAALITAAALSTGFGAFPILLLYFGVLYPNALGYSILPAGLAAVFVLLRTQSGRSRVRSAALLGVMCLAIGIAHPNAFLALYAMGTAIVVVELVRAVVARPSYRTAVALAAVAIPLFIAGVVIWRSARTNFAMSRWGPWTDTLTALRDAFLSTPRGVPISIVIVVLTLAGIVGVILRPRRLAVAAPFAVAALLFVLASGTPVDSWLRERITNPWYNDPFRLAALLPIAVIPLATLGGVVLCEGGAALMRRVRAPRLVGVAIGAVAVILAFSVGVTPQTAAAVTEARAAYVLDENSPLVSADEARLISRLDQTVPADAVVVGSPWTGASLAYALSGRTVMERHVYGNRTEAELYIDAHLSDIDSDPEVCAAVREENAYYVLDFGERNVWSNPDVGADHAGVLNLSPSPHLVLVDSEGAAARLFRIEGC